MTRLKTTLKTTAVLLFSALTMPSCSDMDEYYEEPDWITGSIYEKLADDEQYSIFVKGAQRAGYEQILNGKSILTVMVPTNDAMKSYLSDNYHVSSIDELSDEEVKKLIGFHILYYSFKKEDLINFRPKEGDAMTAKERETADDAGLNYKFRTYSKDPYKKENDTAYVYHQERFIPVFSYKMFETKMNKQGISAKNNYEYFYPSTGWTGDGGFQVANAGVTEYAGIAKNGYIYKIDRVLKPLRTVYDEMKQSGKYTRFLNYYDSFRNYVYNEALTNQYSNLGVKFYDIEFNKGVTGRNVLPPIASEWPVSDYSQIETLARRTFSVFPPTDQALQDFFDQYWKDGGYESLDEVNSSLVQEILSHSIYDENTAKYDNASEKVLSIVFPEEIEAGVVRDSRGQIIKFNTSDVAQEDRIICSNGVLYGCQNLTPPLKFNSVSGPAYQYKKYSVFQRMLQETNFENELSNADASWIVLYPDNTQLRENGQIYIDENDNLLGEAYSSWSSAKSAMVYAHIVAADAGNTLLPTSGSKVLRTWSLSAEDWNYWYVKDGKITNSILYNTLLRTTDADTKTKDDIFVPFHLLSYRGDENGWTNGHAYAYDNLLFDGNWERAAFAGYRNFYSLMNSQRTNKTTEFYGWITLLNKAGLIDGNNNNAPTFWIEKSLMFVPETRALEKAILEGRVPGVSATGTVVGDDDFFDHVTIDDPGKVEEYVQLYYVPISTRVFSNYPYRGWGEETQSSGGLITMQQHEENVNGQNRMVPTNINIFDNGTYLSVGIVDDPLAGTSSKTVKVIDKYDYLPFIFEDGAVHFLEDVM